MSPSVAEWDDHILAAQISPRRRQHFLEEYRQARSRSDTLETVFRRTGAFLQRPEDGDEHRFGFRNVFSYKGPFVDDSNWGDLRAWEFAVAIERFLFKRFDELLGNLPRSPSAPRAWSLDAVLDSIDYMISECQSMSGVRPDLITVSDPESVILLEAHRSDRLIPEWRLPEPDRSQWIVGHFGGIPIIRIPTSDQQKIHVLNVPRFARLTRYDDIYFELRPIDEARAAELLDTHGVKIELPDGVPDTREARLRHLRLRLEMDLWESLLIELLDPQSGVQATVPRD